MQGRLKPGLATAGEAVLVLALALWLGGIIALGAVSAPLVFGELPRPQAAPLMTAIFRRFDGIVLALAGVIALTSLLRAWDAGVARAVGKLRLGVAGALVAAGAASSLWISPKIEGYLRAGAHRGEGAAGQALDRWHAAAEGVARGQVALAALLLVLLVIDARSRPTA